MPASKLARTSIGLAATAGIAIAGTIAVAKWLDRTETESLPVFVIEEKAATRISAIDDAFRQAWEKAGVAPTPEADPFTMARRLSLALTGAAPSVEELKRLEDLPPEADPVQSWLDHLFADPRYHSYFAERLARAYVGVEPGPFLVYRRRRLVNWLADQLARNRPYDEMVRELVAAEGVWTTNPAANFITVSIVQGGMDEGPDERKLAARTSRAFLGVSLDCMECHDDKFGDHWKQSHFHELAAFYAQAEMQLTGVREKRSKDYEYRYLGETDPSLVAEAVPFRPDLLPESGNRRARLAQWITHEQNEAFARAATNRVWALLMGRPLHEPVDDIPLEGPFPAGLEEISGIFVESHHNLQTLIRLIAATAPFQRSSSSADASSPVTPEQEVAWAAFPVTPLRPEQVAGSIIQSASLHALDHESHIIDRLRRFGETNDFVKRFGDIGEDTFSEESGTIPQRLLLMNGKLVSERTKANPILNSSTRLADYAPDDATAVETAFLATLARVPTEEEGSHFAGLLDKTKGKQRHRAMEDIYWALINSTEFSWNR